ncbi:MAG: 50S ribosomal protein L6 [Clostridiaceae bacterium]|jgi:large subunit ribosomal protein L6|nr:50S ribosomal protein L6 [Bacillota bacterium]NLN51789.1 50S ribosomal protein L6 [Clostridiaceae bacterium]
MSRIGNMPIAIPEGVEVSVNENLVTVKNGNTVLEQVINPDISVEIEDGQVLVKRHDDTKHSRSLHGLTRSLINNMVIGVKENFQKVLEISGIGYRAQMEGNKLVLNVGLSHQVDIEQPEGITIEVENQNKITVKGADKQLVGETAAKIRATRIPDAYKGKGIKYDYEILRLKEGKTGA